MLTQAIIHIEAHTEYRRILCVFHGAHTALDRMTIFHPRCHMCADKALHVHKYVCMYVHKSPTMSPICMQWVRKRQWVMKTPSLSGQLTSPTDRSQGSLEHTQVRSLVTWPIHCSRHVQASPSTVLDSHTHPIHMHVRGGRSHLGHWVRSPHYAGVTTVEPRHIHTHAP